MVRLTTRQTKALQRLFKKVDLMAIAFEETDVPDEIIMYITDYSGHSMMLIVQPNGVPKSAPQTTGFEL